MPTLLPSDLLRLYPALAVLPSDELTALCQPERLLRLPEGSTVFTESQPCEGFPLLISGSIKVVKRAASGREMLLYRVEPGGSCIISSSCLLGHSPYTAHGSAESDLCLLLLPKARFEQFLGTIAPFRDFVFHLFAERIANLMGLVEEVAFARLDQRLAKLLLARNDNPVQTTHQHLAEELGSVREIVSRLLKGFANQGLVALGREQITLLDRKGLEQLAADSR